MPGLGGAIAEQWERAFDELAVPIVLTLGETPAALPSMPAASSEATSFARGGQAAAGETIARDEVDVGPRNLRKRCATPSSSGKPNVTVREPRPAQISLVPRSPESSGRQWPRCRGAIRRPLRRGRLSATAQAVRVRPAILP